MLLMGCSWKSLPQPSRKYLLPLPLREPHSTQGLSDPRCMARTPNSCIPVFGDQMSVSLRPALALGEQQGLGVGGPACVPPLFQVDFEQLDENLGQLERRSRAAEESLRGLAKHELATALRNRLTHFLTQCARRVHMLRVIHRRICNRWGQGSGEARAPPPSLRPQAGLADTPPCPLPRFHAFLLYLGYTAQAAREVRITQFCHTLREFALEYRTCRERVLQQQRKRATYRERNKTRGRMITEVGALPARPQLPPCTPFPVPSSCCSPLQTEKFSGVAGEVPGHPSVPVAVGSGPGQGDADSHASMKSLLTGRPEDTTHARRSRGATCGHGGGRRLWHPHPHSYLSLSGLPQARPKAAPQSHL